MHIINIMVETNSNQNQDVAFLSVIHTARKGGDFSIWRRENSLSQVYFVKHNFPTLFRQLQKISQR